MPLTLKTDTAKRPLNIPLESGEPSKVAKISEGGEGAEGSDKEAQQHELLEQETHGMSQNPRLQRYLVAVEYIGTRFFGSQKQPNCRTVAGVLEIWWRGVILRSVAPFIQEAFIKFVGHPVSVVLSSRTDTGVHALSNVFHVDVEHISKRRPNEALPPHEPGVVRRAVNHFLQKEGDITVIEVQCVPTDFHARFRALERTYFYRFLCGPEEPLPVFEKDRAWHLFEQLDLIAIKKACSILVGHHDFSSFRAAGCQASSPVKTLDELGICEVASFLCFPSKTERREMSFKSSTDDACFSNVVPETCTTESNGSFGERSRHRCFVITARARSFLYHQVRLLVGVLKCVGTGQLTLEDVKKILNAKTVASAIPMAPACGLYLGNVKYHFS